jgi:hypothetical protein
LFEQIPIANDFPTIGLEFPDMFGQDAEDEADCTSIGFHASPNSHPSGYGSVFNLLLPDGKVIVRCECSLKHNNVDPWED